MIGAVPRTSNFSMKNLFLLVLVSGCAHAAAASPPEEFRGHYTYGFEVEAFEPCGSRERWWVVRGEELYRRHREISEPYTRVFAVIRGSTGPRGRHGHLGQYEREVVVEEVLEVRPATDDDCRISL